MNAIVFLVCIFLFSTLVYSSRAPDEAPDLPEGWCDKKFGTPTRTTAECICKRACEGRGCQNTQGLIFYSYLTCPTCKCVESSTANAAERKDSSSQPAREHDNEDEKGSYIIKNKKKGDAINYAEDGSAAGVEEEFNLHHWLEDHARFVFAAFITIAVIIMIVLLIRHGGAKHEDAVGAGEGAQTSHGASTLDKKD
jgi:hypothetical protein